MTLLNRQYGEVIEGLGHGFRVVANAKWRDTPLWRLACQAAAEAFAASGALRPVTFDDDHILVQEYPGTQQIAFIFARPVAGQPMHYPYIFTLSRQAIAELRTAGRWEDEVVH